MRKIAFFIALLFAGAMYAATAYAGESQQQNCCSKVVTTTSKRIVGYKMVRVPIYRYHKHHHRVKKPCCAPAKPVEVTSPPPETVVVHKKIYVVEKPEIIRIPSPPIVVRQPPQECCPPGTSSFLPPCPPGVAPTRYGYRGRYDDPPSPHGYGRHFTGVMPTGYVAGAPRSAEECIQRGGRVVPSRFHPGGQACEGYH